MKIGMLNEYVINLCNPFMTLTGATPSVLSIIHNANSDYTAAIFVPHYDMQINRIAVPILTASNQILTGGMTTVDASGFPNGNTGALTFINSGTTSTHSNFVYSSITVADTTLTAGTKYFIAAQTVTFSTSIEIQNRITNGTFSNGIEFPYVAIRVSSTSLKSTAHHNLLCGYNNGQYTQWYGIPNVSAGTAQNLQTNAGAQLNSAGCKFMLPLSFTSFKIKAVGAILQKNTNSSLVCQIFESDNTTQVTNATSVIEANWYDAPVPGSATLGPYIFQFGNYVTLKPNTNYYLKISTTGSFASGLNTNVYYNRINGAALSTSDALSSELMNAYDVVNNYSVTSTGGVYTEYVNARLNAWLICQTMADTFRGTKENGYSGY